MSLGDDVHVISFDLDDTFWDCAPAIASAEKQLWAWLSREAPSTLDLLKQRPIAERRERLLGRHPELAGDVTELRKRLLADLFRDAGLDPETSEDAFDVFYRARSEVVLYDGVIGMLDALRPRYKLAAITNGNADLELIGIADRFDIILKASLVLPAKPHPAMFERATQSMGANTANLLHVGDSGITDVAGAHAAGAAAVWFNPPGTAWPTGVRAPEYTVRSIKELSQLLLA